MSSHSGVPIVLTAPLTESIDHAGFFIQMSLASIPEWMEWVIDKKYPEWRNVPKTADDRAGTAPAGLRVLEEVLGREFGRDQVAVCYPDQLPELIGDDTRVWAAGEAAAMQRIRRHLFEARDVPRPRTTIRGYWKFGRAGTDDDD